MSSARERPLAIALAIASIGLAAWLFGNVYEEIVVIPNFVVGDVHAAMVAFRTLFAVTTPLAYYAVVGPTTGIALALATIAAWPDRARRRSVLLVVACVAPAVALTVYIVVRVNLRLFFGPVVDDAASAHALAQRWLVLNAVRIALVASALGLAMRARRMGPT